MAARSAEHEHFLKMPFPLPFAFFAFLAFGFLAFLAAFFAGFFFAAVLSCVRA